MPLTRGTVIGFTLGCLLAVALGAFALSETWQIWLAREYLLTARRVTPRLVTAVAQPSEFVLRCLFLASMGATLLSAGLLGGAGLIARRVALRDRFLAGPFDVGGWWRLLLIPGVFAGTFLVLLVVLWIFYD